MRKPILMDPLSISSLEELLELDSDPNMAISKCYNQIILSSDSPQNCLDRSLQFAKLFVNYTKWKTIEDYPRDFGDSLQSLISWMKTGLENVGSEDFRFEKSFCFQTYTKTHGYNLELLLRGNDKTKVQLTNTMWHSSTFDDVRALTYSPNPLTGKRLKFSFHASLAVYACYGKLIIDAFNNLESMGILHHSSVDVSLDVINRMLLGTINSSGKWEKANSGSPYLSPPELPALGRNKTNRRG